MLLVNPFVYSIGGESLRVLYAIERVTRSRRLDALMRVFMIKRPDGSATQFQLRFLDIYNPSRPRPDPPDPVYHTG
ncbi:hypothetical protein T03_7753, partial [Trichinella britovi]